MSKKADFASLMEDSLNAGTSRAKRRLPRGETVEGTVIQVGPEFVFVDVGTPGDARVARSEFEDAKGTLMVAVGDKIKARVVDPSPDAPRLAVLFGKSGQALDLSALELARDSGAPVEGQVSKVVKGGLQIEIGGLRAFCPASQVDVQFVKDLQTFEGQMLQFRVTEIREGGRSIVLSRRALLEDRKRELEAQALEQLTPGAVLDGRVSSLNKHGAVVEVLGIDGFVHISELAEHRVDRVEDVVKIGETVTVRVLAIEEGERGRRVRLSMKTKTETAAAPAAPPSADEVLEGTVTRTAPFGVFVNTSKGEGLIPLGELGLAPGADHRRAFPAGATLKVVLLSHDPSNGRLRFSATRVDAVEERRNYREFATQPSSGGRKTGSLGSLGELLKQKLGAADDKSAKKPR